MKHFQQRDAAIDYAAQKLRTITASLSYIKSAVDIGSSEMRVLEQAERLQDLYQTTSLQLRESRSRGKGLWRARIIRAWQEGLAPGSQEPAAPHPYLELLRRMVERSARDPECFDALCLHGAQFVSREEKPVPELGEYIFEVLAGKRVRPRAGGRPQAGKVRDPLLHGIVQEVSWKYGIYPTRNDEAGHFNSACDIVAEAMAYEGLSPSSYSAVKRIWLEQEAATRDIRPRTQYPG